MLIIFRTAAILEGITYLLLFALGMPLKYWGKLPEPNVFIGYAHGVLFILYIILALLFCRYMGWGIKRYLLLFVASLLPFGTFYIDQKYLKGSAT